MRRFFLAIAFLLAAQPASAAKLHILGVYDTGGSAGSKACAQRYQQELTAYGKSMCADFTWVPDEQSATVPLIAYGQGIGSYFKVPYNFDALVVVMWDFGVGVSNSARFDSLSTKNQYPTIPVLFYGTRAGHNSSFDTADSLGWAGGSAYAYPTSGVASVFGTNARLSMSNYATNAQGFQNYADGSDAIVVGGVAATGATNDTALVVRRNIPTAGNGLVSIELPNVASEANSNRAQGYKLLAILKWLSYLPTAKKPAMSFPIALHIDDGFRYTGFFKPQHEAAASAWMDSLKARGVKWTIGVTTDSIPTYYSEFSVWDRGAAYTKFTPHTHSRDNGLNPVHAPTQNLPTDLFGAIAVRPTLSTTACAGTIADTSSIYCNCKTALDTLANYVGYARIDRCVMPPQDDYTPKDMGQTGQPPVSDVLASIRRAGYIALRINSGTSPYTSQAASNNSTIGSYGGPGTYRTGYGDLHVLACPSYNPGATDSTCTTTGVDNIEIGLTTMIASIMQDGMINSSAAVTPRRGMGSILVQHNVNYKLGPSNSGGVGFYMVREICDFMDASSYIYGHPIFRWVWSDQL